MTVPIDRSRRPIEIERTVQGTDGVALSVFEQGRPDAPIVLCVHGFPDDHRVWDGVADELARDFHVVTFDVRGSGTSGRPTRITAYRLDQLAADIGSVVDAVSPGRPVHLVAHDWGSVQAWHAVTDPAHRHRFASMTSISGPCLDHMPSWLVSRLRSGPAGWKDVLGQWKSPIYMGFFQLPWIAPLACRIGLVDRIIGWTARFETGTRPDGASTHRARDNRAGLKIYTANLLPRLLRPRERSTTVPIQILAPRRDVFITPASQVGVDRWTTDATVQSLDGGHWAPLFNPDAVALPVRSFIDIHESRTYTTNLEAGTR